MTVRLQEVDAVLFDLGEVIVDLDPQGVLNPFAELSGRKPAEIRSLIVNDPHLYLYETGQLTDTEFVQAVNQKLGSSISLEDFADAWNRMVKAVPKHRLNLLESLQKTHHVLVLSNTNALHEQRFDALTYQSIGRPLNGVVKDAYYSHRIGLRKPNADSFEFVIGQHHLRPERTLFLDDKMENIDAARAVGLRGIQVAYPDQIFELLT